MAESTFTIPLRKEILKAPTYVRAQKAVRAVRQFVQKHMKSEDVKIGRFLNMELWKGANRHPPARVKVKAKVVEGKEGKHVMVELHDKPFEEAKKEEKKGLMEKLTGRKKKAKPEEKTEDSLSEEKEAAEKEAKKAAREASKQQQKPKAQMDMKPKMGKTGM